MINEEIYRRKYSDYKFQSVIYLISSGNKVLYLHKLKSSEPTHDKLIGWGGKFDEGDDVFSCSIRELREELSLGRQDYEDLLLQGVLIRHDLKRIVYILKSQLKRKIVERDVFNEGKAVYKPIKFHQNSENLGYFMENDLYFLDILFFSNDEFETIVNGDKSIVHRILK